ncbi:HWE histidine kinase domain-containing protein [Bosea sp. CCNWLW174]|uniref:sensor histidine kinase n=1 Tax=unclassified Bosea (in: a-proteobacteria) TaxID=2653178 RepID=UPI0030154715
MSVTNGVGHSGRVEQSTLPLTNPSAWNATNLRRAISAAGVALWSWNVETDGFAMDDLGFELWAVRRSDSVKFEDLSARIHPADRDRVREAFTATRAIVGAYEIDFRIIIGDEIRWISARGIGDDTALYDHQAYGIFLDVTGRKQAEEGHELLAGEMSHRVKNLLAIASGLTQISSRSAKTAQEMAVQLTGRLSALGRAHDLVRPLPGHQGTAALLGDLISILLSPYEDMGAFSGRIRVAVPRMGVGESTATTLALVIHELATNSLKYGALSSENGTLDVSGTSEGEYVKMVWTERGGPEVKSERQSGYGSRLVERSIAGQLGGSIACDWSTEGVVVTLLMKSSRLAN